MEFISCIKWVKQGLAKSKPDTANLNEEELRNLMEQENNSEGDDDTELPENTDDEYEFNNYDEEDDTIKPTIRGLAVYGNNNRVNDNNSDSDEDETIKPDDNLILAGVVGEDEYSLLVYIYNDNDGDMYVHHDIMLSNAPLCVEYLHYKETGENHNICLIGGMEPVIEAWDLDIMGCVEPVFKLGRYKKDSRKNYGHTDAVLDIAWNENLPHILCSASVDKTALLWDLTDGKVATTISQFKGEVQSIAWNTFEPHYLLTASKDKKVRNFDCRVFDEFSTWKLDSAVEKISWNNKNSYICYAGTEQGNVYTLDIRNGEPINCFTPHEKEITGIVYSDVFSKLLLTCAAEEEFKIWDVSEEGKFTLLSSKNVNISALQCMDVNPDLPYLIAVGGTASNKSKLKVININKCVHKQEDGISNSNLGENINIPFDHSDSKFNIPLLEEKKLPREKTGKFNKKKKKNKKKLNFYYCNFINTL